MSPAFVSRLFVKAQALFALRPWDHVNDADVMLVDIPDLGIRGAALSLIGALRESTGFLLFESPTAFRTFYRQASHRKPTSTAPIDFGGRLLSVTYERGADLPKSLRREISRHGWQVATPTAHPHVELRDRDGFPLPTSSRDLRLAEAIVGALVSFAGRYGAEIGTLTSLVTVESQSDDGPTVFLTYPHLDQALDDPIENGAESVAAAPVRATPSVGRNEQCPCGSGKKYKRCHLSQAESEAARTTQMRPNLPGKESRDVEQQLPPEMMRFARGRFGKVWDSVSRVYGFPADEDSQRLHLQFMVPWSVYEYRVSDGRPVVDHFLKDRGGTLAVDERAFLEAQCGAQLSIWEIEEVRVGEGVSVLDLLTGERHEVKERTASGLLVKREIILARVMFDGKDRRFFGIHPVPLPPRLGAAVVHDLMRRIGWAALPVTSNDIKNSDAAQMLPMMWTTAADRFRNRPPPELHNTDGDRLVLIEDEFALRAADRPAVLAALDNAGFARDQDDDGASLFTWHKRKRQGLLEDVVAATLRLESARLVVESNSRKRAAAVRRKVEAAAAGRVVHVKRIETNPKAAMGRQTPAAHAVEVAPARRDMLPNEARLVVRQVKADHWRRWLDESIPALGGRTPRQVAKAGASTERRELDLLLKEAEFSEGRQDAEQRFDIGSIRAELGL